MCPSSPSPPSSSLLLLTCLLLLCSSPSPALGCNCAKVSFNGTMCEAKWVSHVKVVSNDTAGDNNNLLKYTVKHLEVFKSPNQTTKAEFGAKQTAILTPVSDALCGVTHLVAKKEYLLAGTIDGAGLPRVNLCLFVPLVDGKPNPLEMGALAWEAVPGAMKKGLGEWQKDGEGQQQEKCP